MKIVITCEHGGNEIPGEYSNLFKENKEILQTHKGYDLGALELAKKISEKIGDYFFYSQTSRLLVDLNRSLKNRNLFSGITKELDKDEKKELIKKYYFPYRNKIENKIAKLISGRNKIVHISVHSFTPILNNKTRNADVGILFDPQRKIEKAFAIFLKDEILSSMNGLKVRFNYPYLGISDGLTSYLRKKFNEKEYIGIELEINQSIVLNDKNGWKKLKQNLADALIVVLSSKTLF